jgi:hypothetical protein
MDTNYVEVSGKISRIKLSKNNRVKLLALRNIDFDKTIKSKKYTINLLAVDIKKI